MRDVDRILFSSRLVAVGEFRCQPTHPRFNDSGAIREHCFAFPRTTSAIEHDNGARFVGDPTRISLYNAGQVYRRTVVSPEGDHSDYFVVAEAVLRDALRSRGVAHAEADERRLFTRPSSASVPALYLRQRRLFTRVQRLEADAFDIESGVLGLLDDVLAGAEAEISVRASGADVVTRALRLLACRYAEALALDDIAAELGVSPFHLCRLFKAQTGQSLHQHRDQLRLRAALNRLERADDLTTVALDVGYSSHSHFTAAFRRAFGTTPSRVRKGH